MRRLTSYCYYACLLFMPLLGWSQATIKLIQIPENTPQTDEIYLTGTFNQWTPADPNFRMNRMVDGTFQIVLNLDHAISFQFCRGTQESLEGNANGQTAANHELTPGQKSINFSVATWIDLEYTDVTVIGIPPNTPLHDSIYMAGSFNNWTAGDKQYLLVRDSNGYFRTRISVRYDSLEYKYNRGTWPTAEGDELGRIMSNRRFVRSGENKAIIDRIESWEDLEGGDIYTFVIQEIPENTPFDASIYLVGNFNDWKPGLPKYKFTKRENNTYQFTLRDGPRDLIYKYTRGTWSSVEGGWDGRAIQNRTFQRSQAGPLIFYSKIHSWEDLAGNNINYNDFILIIASVVTILVLLAFRWMESSNRMANNLLTIALMLSMISWTARILTNYRDIFNTLPKLVMVSDIIYFTYAPLMYFYVQALLSVHPRLSFSKRVSFIPAGILFLSYLPLMVLDQDTFIDKIVNRDFHMLFAIIGAVALVYNFYFWYRCLTLLRVYTRNMGNTQSFDQSHYFLNGILTLHAATMFMWLAAYLIGGVGYLMNWHTVPVTDTIIDITWVIFSVTPFLVAYFAVSQPELFRQSEYVEKYKYSRLTNESASKLKQQLSQVMINQKPFRNPKLTLLELAEMLETNTNTLSRVINEGYEKNFYDFVNYYRIEEFKKLVNQDNYKNLTFLAIAYEVGFSSKTTFNRAFKKLEDSTPRDFYKELLDEEEVV